MPSWKPAISSLFRAGFEADFHWRQALKPEVVYSFFHHTIPAFEKLVRNFLSDEMNQLYSVQLLRFRLSPREDCWKSSLISEDCPRRDWSSFKALTSNQISISVLLTMYFWWETSRFVKICRNWGWAKWWFFQARKSLAYSLSQLFEGRDRIFFGRISAFSSWFDPPRGLSFGRYTGAGEFERLSGKGSPLAPDASSHYGFGGILADDMGLGKHCKLSLFD